MINNIQKCYLDANVLIAFQDRGSDFHQQAKRVIRNLIARSGQLFVSSLGLDEFLFQMNYLFQQRKKKSVQKKLALAFRGILSLPDLSLANPSVEKKRQWLVLEYMKKFSLRPRDAYHLLIMKENKIDHLATFDKDFKKVFKAGEIGKVG